MKKALFRLSYVLVILLSSSTQLLLGHEFNDVLNVKPFANQLITGETNGEISHNVTIKSEQQPVIFTELEFTSSITLENMHQMTAFQFELHYNAYHFELLELIANPLLQNGFQYNTTEEGVIYVNYANIGLPLDNSVKLFELRFVVKGTLGLEEYPLLSLSETGNNSVVNLSGTTLINIDDVIVDFPHVRHGLLGNVTQSNRLSIVDVATIQLHLAGLGSFDKVEALHADVNGDGKVDLIDTALIQLHLARCIPSVNPFMTHPIIRAIEDVVLDEGDSFDPL